MSLYDVIEYVKILVNKSMHTNTIETKSNTENLIIA